MTAIPFGRGVTVLDTPMGIQDLSPVFRDHLRQSTRYLEFVGGLGDVINRFHQCDWYVSLEVLPEDERVTIGYLGHNPAGIDLFRWIPTRGRVLLMNVGFSGAWDKPEWREKRGLPETEFRPYDIRRIDYHHAPSDAKVLDDLYRIGPYVAFVASAGTPERNIPGKILEEAADLVLSMGYKVVFLGGTYKRNVEGDLLGIPREEVRIRDRYGVFDLIDRLSVPGSVKALERSAGVISAHTALCLASWYSRTPTFLLYNEFVTRQYVPHGPYGYLFGMARPGNDGMEFKDYAPDRLKKFLEMIR